MIGFDETKIILVYMFRIASDMMDPRSGGYAALRHLEVYRHEIACPEFIDTCIKELKMNIHTVDSFVHFMVNLLMKTTSIPYDSLMRMLATLNMAMIGNYDNLECIHDMVSQSMSFLMNEYFNRYPDISREPRRGSQYHFGTPRMVTRVLKKLQNGQMTIHKAYTNLGLHPQYFSMLV